MLSCSSTPGLTYVFHHLLARQERALLTDLGINDFWFKALHDLVADTQFADKLRAHEASIVGDRIVQGERLKRSLCDFVPDGH